MQDPSTVATLLVNAARNYNIPNIYFAIPNRNSRNFRIFLEELIIARRDLNMSPGKLAAQVSHASIEKLYWGSKEVYHIGIAEAETKVVCRAKNKNDLLMAKELGWEEDKDYDACRTELEREGPEGTLTCIGWRRKKLKKYYSPLFFVIEIEKSIQILKWRGRTISPKNFQFFPKYTPPSFTW